MTFSDEGALVDEVLISLRWWGPYQQVQFYLLMIQVVPCAFHAMSVVFLGKPMKHRCAPVANLTIALQENGIFKEYDVIGNQSPYNLTVSYEACSIDVRNGTDLLYSTTCVAGYEYADPIDQSFVSEFDLVCDREAFSDFSQTMLAFGMMVGAFGFSALADRCCYSLFAIALAFSPNFTVYAVMRFLLGCFQQGGAMISTIMLIEMLPKDKRALPSLVGNFVWVGSLMLLCLIAYLAREMSWRYTELILAASSAHALFQWWIIDESLRWLVTNKRHAQIEQLLQKAARRNKIDLETVLGLLKRGVVHMTMTALDKADVRENNNVIAPVQAVPKEMFLMAFVKNKHVLLTTVISCYMWLTVSVTYYGLLMMSTSLTDSLYLGVFLSVVVELPTAFIFIVAIDRLGRKRFLVVSHILAGLSMLAATVLSNVSSAGFGLSSLAARIGGMIAPYSRTFSRYVPWGPGAVFTCLCLLVLVVLRLLPETTGKELPQTLDDLERMFQANKKSGPEEKSKKNMPC
ncbi:unnamed protein product [Candidula unifasciata]|uniref:Organic cation transporter protein n=1 Tax=Candidula unifasciata TaxID=100452 RepID=A0A8S3YPJ2_9EUPU|nr:unnamed protein product [Candidula unifasciata]